MKMIDQATLALNGKMHYESVRKPEEDTEWRNHSFFYSSLKTSNGEEIISGETILTDRFR